MLGYGALFTKLYRINAVLQYTRRRVSLHATLWPSLLFVVLAFIVLVTWSAVDPLRWERREVDSFSGDTIGICNSTNGFMHFALPLAVVMLIPAAMTCCKDSHHHGAGNLQRVSLA